VLTSSSVGGRPTRTFFTFATYVVARFGSNAPGPSGTTTTESAGTGAEPALHAAPAAAARDETRVTKRK
jgi:hypothetical protein